jgi:hypothetical protein
MSGEPKANVFDVVFEAEGRNTAKYRNDIAVHMRGAAPFSVDLPTDEGPYHAATAPRPIRWRISPAA